MTGFRLREVNYSSNTRKGLKSYLLSDGRCFPEVDSIHVGKQIFSMFVKGCHLTVCLWDLQSIWIYYQPHPPHPYSSGSFQRKYPQTPFSPYVLETIPTGSVLKLENGFIIVAVC